MRPQNRRPRRKPNTERRSTGSEDRAPESPEPEFLIVGRVVRPHGIRGEIAMKVMTDYPERLSGVETLYLGSDYEPFVVERIRTHKIGLLVKFEGIGDREEAEALREQFVHIHISDAVPLEEGEYYLYELEGIQVVTEDGEVLGTLTDYIETGANDVYVVTTPEEKQILLPAIPDVILNVDVKAKKMTVRLLEGLI